MGFVIGTDLAITIIVLFIVKVVKRISKEIEHDKQVDRSTKK